ncbi:uncharacterized protein [Eurosta solidaginis]|uniref:uncharacterized protein n=1 Tax=Eurosta solidaginis TaxID=178769 RepID=UPI003530BE45
MEPSVKYESCEDIYIGPGDIIPTNTGQKRHFDYLSNANECNDGVGGGGQYKMQNLGFSLPQQPPKRYRRGEAAVLFSPPFFEVPENMNLKTGDTIIARCVSCRVVLRGHKNVSSNFIKHMKRAHPEVYKMYDNYKILKQHGIVTRPATAVAPREQGYFEPTSFLEALPPNSNTFNPESDGIGIENEQDSETNTTTNTENSQAHSNTDHTDTIENSNDSQLNKNQTRGAIGNTKQPIQQSEVNLSNKTLQAMSKLFDEKLKSFATKTELNEVTKNIMNQVRSRQTTPCSSTIGGEDDEEYDDNNEGKIDERYKNFEKELQNLRERLDQTEQSKRMLQRELHLLEKVVRKRRLIISNLPIAPNQQPKAAVEQLLRERFDMPNVMLESVTVIGNRNRPNQDRQTLLVQIVHENDVNAIFRKSSCLRNTGIYIESQMSQITMRRKEKLMVLRREMLRRNGSLRILVRNAQMLVCDTFFHWDDFLGLCMGNLDAPENELVCGEEAIEELKKLTNLDMKEFLNVLKNYDIR